MLFPGELWGGIHLVLVILSVLASLTFSTISAVISRLPMGSPGCLWLRSGMLSMFSLVNTLAKNLFLSSLVSEPSSCCRSPSFGDFSSCCLCSARMPLGRSWCSLICHAQTFCTTHGCFLSGYPCLLLLWHSQYSPRSAYTAAMSCISSFSGPSPLCSSRVVAFCPLTQWWLSQSLQSILVGQVSKVRTQLCSSSLDLFYF